MICLQKCCVATVVQRELILQITTNKNKPLVMGYGKGLQNDLCPRLYSLSGQKKQRERKNFNNEDFSILISMPKYLAKR